MSLRVSGPRPPWGASPRPRQSPHTGTTVPVRFSGREARTGFVGLIPTCSILFFTELQTTPLEITFSNDGCSRVWTLSLDLGNCWPCAVPAQWGRPLTSPRSLWCGVEANHSRGRSGERPTGQELATLHPLPWAPSASLLLPGVSAQDWGHRTRLWCSFLGVPPAATVLPRTAEAVVLSLNQDPDTHRHSLHPSPLSQSGGGECINAWDAPLRG